MALDGEDLRKSAGWMLGIGAFIVVGIAVQDPAPQFWTVTEVHSGSGFTAEQDGNEQGFTLAHVLVPGQDGETEDDRCLAAESREFLLDRIPEGTEVEIDPKFNYINDAGEYVVPLTVENESVAEGLVSAGLAAPVESEHYTLEDSWSGVERARNIAVQNSLGLYDPGVECTVSGSVQRVEDRLDEALDNPGNETIEVIESSLNEIKEAREDADRVRRKLKGMATWFGPASYRAYALKSSSAGDRLDAKDEKARELMRELEDRMRELERSIDLSAPNPAVPRSYNSDPGGGASPGYTGPRCYAPGGRTWTPCP